MMLQLRKNYGRKNTSVIIMWYMTTFCAAAYESQSENAIEKVIKMAVIIIILN